MHAAISSFKTLCSYFWCESPIVKEADRPSTHFGPPVDFPPRPSRGQFEITITLSFGRVIAQRQAQPSPAIRSSPPASKDYFTKLIIGSSPFPR